MAGAHDSSALSGDFLVSGEKPGLAQYNFGNPAFDDSVDDTDHHDNEQNSLVERHHRKKLQPRRRGLDVCTDDVDDEIDRLLAKYWEHRPGKAGTKWAPIMEEDKCHRCGRKVYPVERIDVGVVYHKGCFKCIVCARQLTLHSFQRELDLDTSKTKEVYCNQHIPRDTKGLGADALGIRVALDVQKRASSKLRHSEIERGWHYNLTESPGFQYAQNVKPKYEIKRRSTLKSFSDFERHGVFEAQHSLEKLHREEEDELYRQMFGDRQEHIKKLDELLEAEKQRTVADLVAWFERMQATDAERKAGLAKVDDWFRNQREQQMKALMTRLADEEQSAVTRLVEKHSREMLILIRKKKKVPTATLR